MEDATRNEHMRRIARLPRRRPEKQFFTYNQVGTALGITANSVRSRAEFRRMLADGDLVALAREIVKRRGMAE